MIFCNIHIILTVILVQIDIFANAALQRLFSNIQTPEKCGFKTLLPISLEENTKSKSARVDFHSLHVSHHTHTFHSASFRLASVVLVVSEPRLQRQSSMTMCSMLARCCHRLRLSSGRARSM